MMHTVFHESKERNIKGEILLPLSPPSLHDQCPSATENFWLPTIGYDAKQITAVTQSLILHRTRWYFVENRNKNTNKEAFRIIIAFACCIIFMHGL